MARMLELEEATDRLLALSPRLEHEQLAPLASLGRYLGTDLAARRTQPSADLSAMDGYALCGEGGPWHRVGESRAGSPFDGSLRPGECTRISTGAHMPEGADRVLIQENASVSGDSVACTGELPAKGRHVRRRGFDFTDGECVLAAGTRMGPVQIALAISAGHSQIEAARALRIAVLDSGDELASDPAHCGDGQIPASNGAMIEALLHPFGCAVNRIGPVADDLEALAAALGQAEDCDVLVTTGGASVGDHDLIRPALETWGAKLDFWKVAIKPGKPLMVATRGKQIVLGLPGNPVSSFVTAALFLLPLVRQASVCSSPLPRRRRLPAAQPFAPGGKRREFIRGQWGAEGVSEIDQQDSSALAALGKAGCLIERPPDCPPVDKGGSVSVLLFDEVMM